MEKQHPTPTGTSARPSQGGIGGTALKPEERHRMVAEAAYYRAERRGFRGGDPEQDWMKAEAEVERSLAEKKTRTADPRPLRRTRTVG